MSEQNNESAARGLDTDTGTQDLIVSINTHDKSRVNHVITEAYEAYLGSEELLNEYVQLVEQKDVKGLLDILYDDDLLKLRGKERIDLQRIVDVVNVGALLESVLMGHKTTMYMPSNEGKSFEFRVYGRQLYNANLIDGLSDMSNLLTKQLDETKADKNSAVDLSSHYKPEVLSLISEYLLNIAANQTQEFNDVGAKRTHRSRI